mmetsp:Transcript_10881/g.16577  ORF Transcript_10881/g.16577 Transcript_10881/m.16577 type:complete len:85 (+) Transcript_10881:1642-1896(+)
MEGWMFGSTPGMEFALIQRNDQREMTREHDSSWSICRDRKRAAEGCGDLQYHTRCSKGDTEDHLSYPDILLLRGEKNYSGSWRL